MGAISAEDFVDIIRVVAARIDEAREALGELDGAIGDADHGASMAKGFAAVVHATREAADGGTGAADLLPIAARSFLNAVGATTGPLYASAFLAAGQAVARRPVLDDGDLVAILAAMADGIAVRGKAQPGDKTMVDAWGPAARAALAARETGRPLVETLAAAARAAAEGRDSTRAMVASKGRAARLGERGLGHVDPGAASAVIVIEAFRDGAEAVLSRRKERG